LQNKAKVIHNFLPYEVGGRFELFSNLFQHCNGVRLRQRDGVEKYSFDGVVFLRAVNRPGFAGGNARKTNLAGQLPWLA
jgi:hypothetical protein